MPGLGCYNRPMKLLLTSAGFTNQTIIDAFRGMLDKPTDESNVVVIPTAQNMVQGDKTWVIQETLLGSHQLGWKGYDIVDLAAVASLPKETWVSKLYDADVILVGGGNNHYLSYWMERSGFAEMLPELLKTRVYVGISTGSIAAGISSATSMESLQRAGLIAYDESGSIDATGQMTDSALGLVSFAFRSHFGESDRKLITAELMHTVARQIGAPVYALDDASAIKVVDTETEVVSEGQWKVFEP